MERVLIQKALKRHDGNLSRAAEALGLSPPGALPAARQAQAMSRLRPGRLLLLGALAGGVPAVLPRAPAPRLRAAWLP